MAGPILPGPIPNQSSTFTSRPISIHSQHSSDTMEVKTSSDAGNQVNDKQQTHQAGLVTRNHNGNGNSNGKSSSLDQQEWESINVTASGKVKSESIAKEEDLPKAIMQLQPVAADPPHSDELDEATKWERHIYTFVDEGGQLWPELRRLRVKSLRNGPRDGGLQEEPNGGYKYSIAPGTYLRYVKNSKMFQRWRLWAVHAPAKFSDHKVDVLIVDVNKNLTPAGPLQEIHSYSLLQDALSSRPASDTVPTRLILCEDLSPAMIEALGGKLDLDPEFFAEHLAGVEENYVDNVGTDVDGAKGFWPREFLKGKDYFSITWKRRALEGMGAEGEIWDRMGIEPLQGKPQHGKGGKLTVEEIYSERRVKNSNVYRGKDLLEVEYEVGIAVALEERVSVYFKQEQDGGLTIIILFDPIRRVRSSFIPDPAANIPATTIIEESFLGYSSRSTYPLVSYNSFHQEGRIYTSAANTFFPTRIDFLTYLCLALSSTNPSRSPVLKKNNIIASPSIQSCENRGFHYISTILHFALTDWEWVLHELDVILDKIDSEVSVDTVLQENISIWRQTLGVWRKLLVKDKNRITETLRVLTEFGSDACTCPVISASRSSKRGRGQRNDIEVLQSDYNDLLARITLLIERMERVFAAIMSSMSIVESQRAIAQAESVSRVTELAFIFIPLSFSASLFGMEIPAWSDKYTPAMWAGISGGLVVAAYTLRLLVRARIIAAVKDQCRASLKKFIVHKGGHGAVGGGGGIPTGTVVRWLVWKLWMAVVGLAVVAGGISCLWKFGENLGYGTKVGVTVVLGFLGATWCVVLYLWRCWNALFKDYDLWMQKVEGVRAVRGEGKEGSGVKGMAGGNAKRRDGWIGRETKAKWKAWREMTWRDRLFPEGREVTVRQGDIGY